MKRGSSRYGLKQIYEEHGEEFRKMSENMDSEHEISKFIRETMERNNQGIALSKGGGKMNVFYPTSRNNYLEVVISSDGHILTAYPLSSPDIEWQITTEQARIDLRKHQIFSKLHYRAPKHSLLTDNIIRLREGNKKGGLKFICSKHAEKFEDLIGIDNKEDVSKFIKQTMERAKVLEVIEVEGSGINVLYETKNHILLLVLLSTEGIVLNIFLKSRKEEHYLKWSITTTEAGIPEETLRKYFNEDSWLRSSHIIYANRAMRKRV